MTTQHQGLGLGSPLLNAGAPSAGTDEVQTLTFGGTITGGSILLTVNGIAASVAWSATTATLLANVDAALVAIWGEATAAFTVADSSLSSGIGDLTITYVANMGKLAVPLPTITNNLTGTTPTAAIVETTPGVTATARGCAPGAQLIDTTNKKIYINTGTAIAPTWTVQGSQS